MITTAVPVSSWCCVGQSTFFSSAHDSEMKRLVPPPGTRRPPPWVLTGCAAGRCAARACARCADADCARAARFARRSDLVSRAIGLAGLPVRGVLAAPAAELGELDAVGIVPLRLLR